MTTEITDYQPEGIAIIGMAGRFPGAQDVDSLWKNICEKKESISFFNQDELEIPPNYQLHDENSVFIPAKGIIDDFDKFDAKFWGYLPREAATMDPQQRLFLEYSWNALEHGGYDSERYNGAIGVYGGCYFNTYLLANLCSDAKFFADLIESIQVGSLQTELGNDKDYLTTRVSHKLNLRGPSVNIQCACSTSLVAVVQACHALQSYQCDMALAGGVTLTLPLKKGYFYKEGGMLSKDGHCRAFDADAAGTVFSNAVAVILLKRESEAIADGDTIHAVIRGAAANNDGSEKLSYTAPSVDGQAEVIRMAHSFAEIKADTIGYVETHGTGTPLGDPIEIEALTQAFRETTHERQFCAVGSIKANIGHLDVASGATGVIKAAMALKNKLIPPQINFVSPNPKIDFPSSPFYVNTELKEWPAGEKSLRRAAVSSFGVGGTNAHIVMEEPESTDSVESSKPFQLLLLSAQTEKALSSQAINLARHLEQNPDLSVADVAYTLQVGRRKFQYRRMVICNSIKQAIAKLEDEPLAHEISGLGFRDPSIVFMFPGQGAQYPGMAYNLYTNEEIFRSTFDSCAEILIPTIGGDLREILFDDPQNPDKAETLKQTTHAQPAIFSIEYAIAQLWLSWGIHPSACIGHSVGEFAAACVSGIFPLDQVLHLVALRGRLMQEMPAGAMLSVRKSADQIAPYLSNGLSIAAINGPLLCVVSGPFEKIAELQKRMEEEAVPFSSLHTSHAFHSSMMDPVVGPTVAAARNVSCSDASYPIMSTVTGDWMTNTDIQDPQYWGRNLRETVNFAGGIQSLLEKPHLFLEVGPGQTLATLAKQMIGDNQQSKSFASLGHVQSSSTDMENIISAAGRIWLAGGELDWTAFHDAPRRRIPLPTYPFEQTRHWVEPGDFGQSRTAQEKAESVLDYRTLKHADSGLKNTELKELMLHQLRLMKKHLTMIRKSDPKSQQ